MRSFFFLQIQEHLERLTDDKGEALVKTYDLWNEQVDFIEEEEPFARPAVFLEFMLSAATQTATVPIRLHIVTDWKGSSRKGSKYQQQTLERFSLLEKISRHLHNFQGNDGSVFFDMFRRTASDTNHNHSELIEDIEEYTFRVTQKL